MSEPVLQIRIRPDEIHYVGYGPMSFLEGWIRIGNGSGFFFRERIRMSLRSIRIRNPGQSRVFCPCFWLFNLRSGSDFELIRMKIRVQNHFQIITLVRKNNMLKLLNKIILKEIYRFQCQDFRVYISFLIGLKPTVNKIFLCLL